MKRRTFLKKSTLYTAGAIALPTLLPSGRLFAATGYRRVNHVVFCLFAGGIRNFESVHKKEGNLMPNTLKGTESISSDISEGIYTLPKIAARPLQTFGTLFKEFRYKSSIGIHYTAHAASITGNYCRNVQIMQPLPHPSIFEYYRKHSDPSKSALDAWWVCDQSGPFPFLNFSNHKLYGPLFGANMIQPSSFFDLDFSKLDSFTDEQIKYINELRGFFNKNFQGPSTKVKGGVINSEEDRYRIEQFIKRTSQKYFSHHPISLWGLGDATNDDLVNIFTAIRILEEFKPELLVVNMQDSDIGHSNFTKYCSNIHKADFALHKLWEAIQSIPELQDDTVLIVAPEFGRNLEHNTIMDAYGRYAIDHTGDAISKEIFCLILGPEGKVYQHQVISEEYGETIDIAVTIADLLGFKDNIPYGFLKGSVLEKAFV